MILAVVILNTLQRGQWGSLTVAILLLVVANVILYVALDTVADW